MDYRKLGRSGLKVSPLCLGTMMFGGQTGEPESTRIIEKARHQGLNFIDTADVYNQGRSEEVVGRAIRTAEALTRFNDKLRVALADRQRALERPARERVTIVANESGSASDRGTTTSSPGRSASRVHETTIASAPSTLRTREKFDIVRLTPGSD